MSAAYAVCFNIENVQEVLVKHILDYINDCSVKSSPIEDTKDESISKLIQQTEKFKKFALANMLAKTGGVTFSLCTIHADEKLHSIQLYTKSKDQFTDVTLPCKPHKPLVRTVRSSSVTLWLEVPDDIAIDGIVSYGIENSTTQSITWKRQRASISKDTCTVTVSNLTPETQYLFMIAVQYPYGITEDSDISEPITTLHGGPKNPQVHSKSSDSIKIKWTKPHGSAVDYYNVSYALCTDKSNGKVIKAANMSVTIKKPPPGTFTVCEIVAIGKFGESEACSFNFDSNANVGEY